MNGPRRREWLYRLLLLAYPATFRQEYGRDAVEAFRDARAEAGSRGPGAVVGLWARTVPDVLVHGAAERLRSVGDAVRGGGVLTGEGGEVLRASLRGVVRAPALSLVVVGTLGLGIGANVALFSIVRGVVLRPLPYPDAGALVQLWERNPDVDEERHGPSPWNFDDWHGAAPAVERSAAWYLTSATYRADDWAEEVRSARVTVDFFRTLGVSPALGRDFVEDEVLGVGPAMLSHGAWQRLFGGDPTVVGRTVSVAGAPVTIAGVMPRGFAFPDESVEVWLAWNIPATYAGNPDVRTHRFLSVLGRLSNGATIESAEEQLDRIAAGLAESYPEMNRGWDVEVSSLHEDVVGDVRGTVWLAFVAVAFILLIACANVANLLLARVPTRVRDIGIRTTLGASRGRIAAEVLVEHLLLGVAAGALGLGIGRVFLGLLVRLDAGRIPRLEQVGIDGWVFAFTALVAVGTSLLFGAAPLSRLLGGGEPRGMRSGVRTTAAARQRRLRELFVASQVAMVMVLLAGAGLFATSLGRLMAVDPGLDPEGVAAFRVSLDPGGGSPEGTVAYYRTLLREIESEASIVSAGAAQTLALSPVSNDFDRPYRAAGSSTESADASTVRMRMVTEGYIETMGMTVLAGTTVDGTAELDDPLVAVVNETLASRLFPDGNAVGQTFELDFRGGWLPYRVIGVVQDVRHYGLRGALAPEVFLPHSQIPYLAMHVVVKTAGDPEASFARIREIVLSQVPRQPPHDFVSLSSLMRASTAEERFLSVLLTLFSAVGLVLACTGVYGVVAYTVTHRRRDIGVRMALGARPGGVVRDVVRQTGRLALAGVVVGGVAVLLGGSVVESLLYEVSVDDPRSTIGVGALLMSVAALSAWLAARKAAGIPPSEALRPD